jgi:hypothetical protein
MKKSFSQRAASVPVELALRVVAKYLETGCRQRIRLASCFGMRSCTAAWAALIIILEENVQFQRLGIYPRHSLYMRIARSKCFWQ